MKTLVPRGGLERLAAAGHAVAGLTNLLAELPRGEYRVLFSIVRIRRRKDGTEKGAELVRESVSDFKKSSQRRDSR